MDYATYGGKWIGPRQSNGEFDYWLVLELINWHDVVGEGYAPAHYHVSLSVVSPQEAGEENLAQAKECCGEEKDMDDTTKVKALHDYGVCTPVWSKDGNNYRKLMREAHKQTMSVVGLFGFYMDRPVNALGSTGWDFVKGNITAGLSRAVAQ
jgi:hypothetical protein